MYKTVLFDLDGTLTDSSPGITRSAVYALRKMGVEENDPARLRKFIGPPLFNTFQKYYGFSEEESRLAITYYREYFSVDGKFENSVYDGVPEMLDELKRRGKRLVVATSKPEQFAKEIVEHFGLAGYFDFVAGATMDESRNTKSAVLAYAIESCGLTDTSELVMVGDRHHDVDGANEFGINCIGVLYGYGDKEELTGAGAAYIAETPADILKYIE